MATKTWTGNAAAVRQIDLITVALIWAAADTVTMTINGKDLVVTIGTAGTSTANVAAAIRDAWNATSRLDSEGATDATSNFGGQEHGEFSEVTASIDDDSTSVVILTGNTPGKPFVLTVTEVTAGTGTATESTSQAATGPNHWNNGDNWDDLSVPANDDTVVFKESNVSCKYGLPTALEVTGQIYQSFTGTIGLARMNTDNTAKPYLEYRARTVQLSAAGTGTAITHTFGVGAGNGSPLINWTHDGDVGLTVSALVYNTGTPQISGTKALNLEIANSTSVGSITILKGSVDLAPKILSTQNVATLNIGYTNSQATDCDVTFNANGGALVVTQAGGNVEITDLFAMAGNLTISMVGGTMVSRLKTSANTVSITIVNATLVWSSAELIDSLVIGTGGTFDLEKDMRAVTISTCDLYEGASLLDEFARGVYSAGIDLNRCGIDDVTVRVGNNRRLTISAAA